MVELAGEGCGCDCLLVTIGTSLALQRQKITKKTSKLIGIYIFKRPGVAGAVL